MIYCLSVQRHVEIPTELSENTTGFRRMRLTRTQRNMSDSQRLTLEDWFDDGFGRYVLAAEATLLDGLLPTLFGYHLMQLGISRRVSLYDSSPIRHKFRLAPMGGGAQVSALAEPEQLPIDSESVDVVLLHHALEYSANPHQLLREAARVVMPQGHLLVFGFNPWSLFGACALPARHFGHAVWRSQLLAVRRVADWLGLLDFAIDGVQYRVHGLPVDHAPTLARFAAFDRVAAGWSLPGGAIYLIHARKQIARLTPLRNLRWQAPRLGGVSLAAPRARNQTLH